MTFGLFLILFTITSTLQSKENEPGFFRKAYTAIGSAAYAPISAFKSHCENHGAGNQAIKEVDTCFEIIKKQQEDMALIAANNERTASAIEQLAHGGLELAKVQDRRNDILGGVAQVGQVVGVVYSAVYIVRSGYDVGHWVYRYFRPTEETILRKKIVEQKLKSWYSKVALNRCLGRHLGTEKNAQGMLVRCQDEALLFVEMAGIKEYKEILEVLKD